MDRDPAPDPRTPHAGQESAAQPLTDILLSPPARASRPPAAPFVEAPPSIELTIDGATVSVPAGTTILGACTAQGIDTPTLCYVENLDAGQRVPGLRRRGRGVARARPGLLAQGRGRDGGPDRLRARPPLAQDGPRVPRVERGPLARRADRAGRVDRGLCRTLRRRRDPLRTAGPGRLRRRTRPPRIGPPPRASRRRHRGNGRPADEGRQQPLRARLLEMHPLLQVRRRVWGAGAEHVRDRGRGPRLRRPHLHRGPCRCPSRRASTAATASGSARPAP